MQQILTTSVDFLNNYKGFLIFLENEKIIYINISENALPHLLGVKKINTLKNKDITFITKRIRNGKISKKNIHKDRTIPKSVKNGINNKIKAINVLIDGYKDLNIISIYKNIEYATYESCFVIKINGAVLCLNVIDQEQDFYNCHLRSIRWVAPNSKENALYENQYSKIKEIKWSKKSN